MAQTRRRRRKHRGTQGGRVDLRGRRGRPRSRQEARSRARQQLGQKRDAPPTLRSSLPLALFASAVFGLALIVLFRQPVAASLSIAALMFVFYLPMSYFINRFQYNRRQATRQRERERRARGE